MDYQALADTLRPLLVSTAIATDRAEQLRASLEDHASVLPAEYLDEFETLVAQLRDLRDDLHDAGLDPHDDTAAPRRHRPGQDRPPARLEDVGSDQGSS